MQLRGHGGGKKKLKMKNLNPLEKDIEAKVVDHAKSLGILCYKFTSPSRRSVPDRMFITNSGVVFFIEFKRAGATPTAAQEVEIKKIRATGVTVYVADTVESGKRFVGIEHYGLGKSDLDEY
jgi:hypothetical protein